MFEYPLLLVFPAAMAFAGAMDLLTMTIPNRISLALVAAFALLAPFSGIDWQVLLINHVGVGLAVLAAGILLFSLGWMGGGDAKLLAAAALWLGSDHMMNFMFGVSVLGGVLSLVILGYRYYIPAAAVVSPPWAVRLHTQGTGIPYGIAISGAALAVYPATQWFHAIIG